MPKRLNGRDEEPMWAGAEWFKHRNDEVHLHGVFAEDGRVDITPVCGRIDAIGQIQEALDPNDMTARCSECSQYGQGTHPSSQMDAVMWVGPLHALISFLDCIHEEL